MQHTLTIEVCTSPTTHVRVSGHGEIIFNAPNMFASLTEARYYAAGLHDGLALTGLHSVIAAERPTAPRPHAPT